MIISHSMTIFNEIIVLVNVLHYVQNQRPGFCSILAAVIIFRIPPESTCAM